MSQVTVTIDGKAYRMACEAGQEEHLMALAGRFDRYLGHLKEQFGSIGDQRLTVMAGIMIMDEMTELQKRVETLEGESAALRKGRDEAQGRSAHQERALTGALNALAERMEGLAERLNG